MVPKPGFTNQNPTIDSIHDQNTGLMSDPTFFQDMGLQGIYMCVCVFPMKNGEPFGAIWSF